MFIWWQRKDFFVVKITYNNKYTSLFLNNKQLNFPGDPIIQSGTEDLVANNYPSEITIILATTYLVSGLQFDKVDVINSFIIEYEINSERILYKDNHLQEDVTVSLNSLCRIALIYKNRVLNLLIVAFRDMRRFFGSSSLMW